MPILRAKPTGRNGKRAIDWRSFLGASNRPRRAALEHRGNLIRTPPPRPQARAYASCLELVEPLPSPFVRLLLVSCSWQNSRREILRAKSPGPASTVNVERRGNRASNTLTGADGLYNGRSVSRQKQPPITNSFEIRRVCASAIVGHPLYWAILSFLVKEIGRRDCATFSNAGLFAIRNGARGKRVRG